MADREWITDDPLEKFADIPTPGERVRRHLPKLLPYRQYEPTAELEMRREVDARFRLKKAHK